MYTTILVVDVFDVGAARLSSVVADAPVVWIILFGQASPTEFVQWLGLGVLAMAGASLAGRLRVLEQPRAAAFWRLIGFAAVLMIIEDAGDIRHSFRIWGRIVGLLEGNFLNYVLPELIWYGAIASVFAWAIIRHRRHIIHSTSTVIFGSVAIVFYGFAAIGSLSRQFWWYDGMGRFIDETLLRGRLNLPPDWDDVHMHLTDMVVEESAELLGIAFLLAAALAYRRTLAHTDARPAPIDASDSTEMPNLKTC